MHGYVWCMCLLLSSLKLFENFRNKRKKKTEANVKEFHMTTSKPDSLSNRRSNDLKSTKYITSSIKYRKQ